MTVFPTVFKVGITHPHRHSEFISESVSFKNGFNRNPSPTSHAINREAMKQPNSLRRKKHSSLPRSNLNT
jgi:plasmid rolling circle replication initiator protein Rep